MMLQGLHIYYLFIYLLYIRARGTGLQSKRIHNYKLLVISQLSLELK